MLQPRRRPTPPGVILREHYLKPRSITIAALARSVNHSYKHISQVVNGKAAIEARLAYKLAEVLGTTPELWLNLQNAVDLWDAREELAGWKPQARYPAQPAPVGSTPAATGSAA